MDTEANNMRAPEDIEGTDFECDNLDDMGMGEDFDAIDAEEDEDKDLDEDKMENPITKSVRKSDDDEDDDDGDKDDDDDMDKSDDDDDKDDDDKLKKQVAKGGLTEASLSKSIANLARFAERSDPQARKKALMQRALTKSLSKSEMNELMSHLKGDVAPEAKPRQLSKGLSSNRKVQSSVDVSEYLAGQHQELVKALNDVERRMESLASQNAEFQILLAKAVSQTGQGVLRLNKSMAQAEAAPARAPKSVGVTGRGRPLQKSGMGNMTLTKGQAGDALDALLQQSRMAGRYGRSESGADLLKACTHFESSNGQLMAEVQGDVRRYIRENR